MSQHATRTYRRLEQQQQAARDTAERLRRYGEILDDMVTQGLDSFLPEQYESLRERLKAAEGLLQRDPFAALEMSRLLGPEIGKYPRLARAERTKQARTGTKRPLPSSTGHEERTRRPTRPKTAIDREAMWRELTGGWDPLERDIVHDELMAYHRSLMAGPEPLRDRVAADLARIRSDAQMAITQMQVDSTEAPEAPDLSGQPAEIGLDIDPEGERRLLVSALWNALSEQGFQTENPRLVGDTVIIRGTRVGGASASFEVALDGYTTSKFDGYQGQACQTDLRAIEDRLKRIYGFDLGDEEVHWRNPDDEDGQIYSRHGSAG